VDFRGGWEVAQEGAANVWGFQEDGYVNPRKMSIDIKLYLFHLKVGKYIHEATQSLVCGGSNWAFC